MALRAGYYGLKNSVKKKLEKLAADMAGAKIIKTIGDGLNLTNAGKLNVTAATASKLGGVKVGEGLAIEDDVLSCTVSGGVAFSTTEFDTGFTWIDGKKIYGKVFNNVNIPNNAFSLSLDLGANADISKVLYFNITEGTASSDRVFDYRLYGKFVVSTDNLLLQPTCTSRALNGVDAVVFYTKTEVEEE